MPKKSNSTKSSLFLSELNAAEPDASELVDISTQTEPVARSCARRYNRIVRWGAKQLPRDLRAEVAMLFMKLMIERSSRRHANEMLRRSSDYVKNYSEREAALITMTVRHKEHRRAAAASRKKVKAMREIKAMFFKWQARQATFRSYADFGNQMAAQYGLRDPRNIAENCTVWGREWRAKQRVS